MSHVQCTWLDRLGERRGWKGAGRGSFGKFCRKKSTLKIQRHYWIMCIWVARKSEAKVDPLSVQSKTESFKKVTTGRVHLGM